MAKIYRVVSDTSEKEKIIGGVLTMVQGGWLALGFLITGILLSSLTPILPYVVATLIALPPGLIVGLVFAFYKKHDTPFMTYLLYKFEFNRKKHQLLNTFTHQKAVDDSFSFF